MDQLKAVNTHQWRGRALDLSVSIGMAPFPSHGRSAETLLIGGVDRAPRAASCPAPSSCSPDEAQKNPCNSTKPCRRLSNAFGGTPPKRR